jgi:hypothetical protein
MVMNTTRSVVAMWSTRGATAEGGGSVVVVVGAAVVVVAAPAALGMRAEGDLATTRPA